VIVDDDAKPLVINDQGPCNNSNDLGVFKVTRGSFHNILQDCAKSCWGQTACTGSCLSNKLSLSGGCANCFGKAVNCAIIQCWDKCIFAPGGQACIECSNNNCRDDLITCTGVDGAVLPP
jgi:hypothetical protein